MKGREAGGLIFSCHRYKGVAPSPPSQAPCYRPPRSYGQRFVTFNVKNLKSECPASSSGTTARKHSAGQEPPPAPRRSVIKHCDRDRKHPCFRASGTREVQTRQYQKNFLDFMEEARLRAREGGGALVAPRQEAQDAPRGAPGRAASRLWFRSKAG